MHQKSHPQNIIPNRHMRVISGGAPKESGMWGPLQYGGYASRNLTKERFFKLWKCFMLNEDMIGNTSKTFYLEHLNPKTINIPFTIAYKKQQRETDLLTIAIENNQQEAVQILNEKLDANINIKHLDAALFLSYQDKPVTVNTIYPFLLNKTTHTTSYLSSTIMPKLFELADQKKWDSLIRVLEAQPVQMSEYINTQPRGFGLIHLASSQGTLAAVQKLVEKGAQCNIQTQRSNKLPLHHSIASSNEAISAYLLKQYPEAVIKKDANGKVPLQNATPGFCHSEIYREMHGSYVKFSSHNFRK